MFHPNRNATLADEKAEDAHTIKAMKFSVSPVVRVAVETKVRHHDCRPVLPTCIFYALLTWYLLLLCRASLLFALCRKPLHTLLGY